MRFLLDTNVLSEAVKTTPSRDVMAKLEAHQAEIATAAPVWHELHFGCLRMPPSRKRDLIQSYLEEIVRRSIPILPYDEQAAEWHARERSRLSATGNCPSFVDGQIAAIASINGLTLVTRNTADFSPFADLRIVDWHAPR
jgi:tRNA(fMet)-specific endonuclease VapC